MHHTLFKRVKRNGMRHFSKLIEYETWANRKIVAALTEAQEGGRALALLSHLLSVQKLWLDLIQQKPLSTTLWQERTLSECVDLMEENEQHWKVYLDHAAAEELEQFVIYPPANGSEPRKIAVRDAITGIIIHSSYHRGQIILHLKGKVELLPLTTYPSFASIHIF